MPQLTVILLQYQHIIPVKDGSLEVALFWRVAPVAAWVVPLQLHRIAAGRALQPPDLLDTGTAALALTLFSAKGACSAAQLGFIIPVS